MSFHPLKCKLALASLIFIFLQCTVLAQNEDFASDRPGLSDSPDLIDVNSMQISSGFDISKYNHYALYQLSTNTLKYGINKHFEARLDLSLQYDKVKKLYGASSPSIGLKTLLFDQKKILPKAALVIEYYPPPFSSVQQPSGFAAEFCFSNEFENGNNLYYNVGSSWQDIKGAAVTNCLVGYLFELDKKTSTFIELYLYNNRANKLINYVSDLGVTYQLNKDLQLDFSAGLDLVKPKGNLYFEGGISYNF